jgi:nicotinamidase-related amidase
MGSAEFADAFKKLHRSQAIVTGIETHICVYQTARDVLASGCEVHVAADCVGSRFPENKRIGIERMKDAGGIITSVETALFEMLQAADDSPRFREIVEIIR